MVLETKQYWPFQILPLAELSDHQRKELRFLQDNSSTTRRSYIFGTADHFGVESQSGRVGELLRRGGNRYWEIILSGPDDETIRAFIDGFVEAARLAQSWTEGCTADVIHSMASPHIVSRPGERGR